MPPRDCAPITKRDEEYNRPLMIGANATRDARDASPAIFGQPGTKCLISPKFVKIVIKLPAELMRMMQPAFGVCSTSKTLRQSERVRPYFARAVTSSATHF